MEDTKKVIKEDINFLEYPNWVLNRRSKATSWFIEKPHGKYEIDSPRGLPTHFDKLILYYLLYKLSEENQFQSLEILTTRYEIAKHIFGGKKISGKDKFDRIIASLKRWKGLSINFEGLFYEGDGYTIRGFAIIDEYVFHKTSKKLYIRFNNAYIKQLQETKFYKLIDFEQYKNLSRGISARLYEILIKTFKERDSWSISLQALAEKLTLEKRKKAKAYYTHDVLAQVKPGINEINKKTDLHINFEYHKNTTICVFKKIKKGAAQRANAQYQGATLLKKSKNRTGVASTKELVDPVHQACFTYFLTLDTQEQTRIMHEVERHPFIRFIPEKATQVYAYMTALKLWPIEEVQR